MIHVIVRDVNLTKYFVLLTFFFLKSAIKGMKTQLANMKQQDQLMNPVVVVATVHQQRASCHSSWL